MTTVPHHDESINNVRSHQTAVDHEQIQDKFRLLFPRPWIAL